MLVLLETPAGYSLFQVSNDKKLSKTDPDDIFETFFRDSEKASKNVSLVSFQAYKDTADAVAAATATMEGKTTSSLKSFLKKQVNKALSLAVADKTLAASIKADVGLSVVSDSKTHELFRGIRSHLETLLDTIGSDDMKAMQLGLSHSLSRYKLKFSADKVDTMVIQAVGLLDELDKEINTYAMRVKEWYGWHFPELQGLVSDSGAYCQIVLKCGFRTAVHNTDFSDILEDQQQEAAVKEAAEISMGTEIADNDVVNIQSLATQVLSMSEYRTQLFEYLRNRMNAIAPNLTILVGELVGARLMSHAGSLMNLAKQPASTVQILGAEKALFRALKTKHDTPKYGLIYHASLIGQASPKNKGKISRVLAAKASLAIRVDALSDDTVELDTTIGFEGRAKVEARLRQLEGGAVVKNGDMGQKTTRYDPVAAKASAAAPLYNAASDMVMGGEIPDEPNAKKDKKEKKVKKDKKRKAEAVEDQNEGDEATKKSAKKAKKEKSSKRKSKD